MSLLPGFGYARMSLNLDRCPTARPTLQDCEQGDQSLHSDSMQSLMQDTEQGSVLIGRGSEEQSLLDTFSYTRYKHLT